MNEHEYTLEKISYSKKEDCRIIESVLNGWFQDPKTLNFVSPNLTYPFKFKDWISKNYIENSKQKISIVIKSKNWIVGHISYSIEKNKVHLFHLIIDKKFRGIGLANKMRAYSLQSKGLDTIDADHNIGFLDDERDFNIAAKILKLLKVNKVNIITNNFTKVSSLKKAGIKVAKQINTKPTINKFNKNYFKTRVKKTGYGFKNLD